MNPSTTFHLALPEPLCPDIERTSSGRDLADALDAWLAEDFTHEDYLHVHSWNDDEEMAR
jgi:hypothetical protein